MICHRLRLLDSRRESGGAETIGQPERIRRCIKPHQGTDVHLTTIFFIVWQFAGMGLDFYEAINGLGEAISISGANKVPTAAKNP